MGVDISDEMIRRAREKSRAFANVTYHCGQAEQIPKVSGYFTKIMSIEAFYYFERQDEVLLGRDDAEGNIATKSGDNLPLRKGTPLASSRCLFRKSTK